MEEHEELQDEAVARVAAIDIAKNNGVVCMRLPNESREEMRTQQVWTVAATTNAILELGDKLLCQGVELVVMEATGTYWRPFYYLLEGRGLRCWLVNARQVKNVPGRPKTDKLDAVWLAKLTERGMVRASFVPPKPVRQLRDFTRTRTVFVQERTRHKQRIDKVLQDAQIKLSSVATDSLGVSGRAMMEALIAGERNPCTLANLAQGKLVAKHDALVEALTGQFEEHHARLLQLLLATVDHLTAQIAALDQEIAATLADLPDPHEDTPSRLPAERVADASFGPELLARLDEIPGVGPASARVILAEIGADMSVFPTPGHLASWAKLSPRTIQSGQQDHHRAGGQRQPLVKGSTGRSGKRRRPDRHLPRRPLPTPGQTPRPREGPGRGRPLHPGHRLAPDERPTSSLPGPRSGLAPTTSQSPTQDPRPRATTRKPRPPGHTRPGHRHRRLNTSHRLIRTAPPSGCCRLPG